MKYINYLLLFIPLALIIQCSQPEIADKPKVKGLSFHINKKVENAEEPDEKAIIQLWKDYLNSNEFVRGNDTYWDTDDITYPDYPYVELLIGIRNINKLQLDVQHSVLGIFLAEQDHYCLKSMFSMVDDSTGQIQLRYITSVYAKKINDEFKLVSSVQYHKRILEHRKIGNINYYIHPGHEFKETDANKMNAFNKELAKKYGIAPLEFDYFVTTYGRELIELMGYDFMDVKYLKVQSGGMADNMNTMIFAGNNSAYYPHEVVHLYNYQIGARQYHSWVDEGTATFLGGSTGYPLEWHIKELKAFLAENPDYPLGDLSTLEVDIPNGKYTTQFRYVIGGYLMKLIHEKEGMAGIIDALRAGKKDEDFWNLLKDKLNISPSNFDAFIKNEMKQYNG